MWWWWWTRSKPIWSKPRVIRRVQRWDKQQGKKDYSKLQCFRYDKFGHFVSRCPERKKEKQANLIDAEEIDPSLFMVQDVQEIVYLNEEEIDPSLFMIDAEEIDPSLFMVQDVQEIVYLNEEKVIPKNYENGSEEKDLWYMDNGASNHMTGNISFFL
ncbi:putative transcription factor interactor and regulator CCHC(Zn) family [Helianthus annuus]|nr:putative transcription factor interactor and regulator CCHC(Zn) family [Helianthus annuus]